MMESDYHERAIQNEKYFQEICKVIKKKIFGNIMYELYLKYSSF